MMARFDRAGGASPGPRASVAGANSELYRSARALAQGFKSSIFEPTWWPEDTAAVTYQLDRLPSSVVYKIESTRHDGTPICVIGGPENPRAQLATGNWHQPPELAALRGLVRTNDAHVHAVVHDEQQTIHLIGYASEAEVVHAVKSLRQVTAD